MEARLEIRGDARAVLIDKEEISLVKKASHGENLFYKSMNTRESMMYLGNTMRGFAKR